MVSIANRCSFPNPKSEGRSPKSRKAGRRPKPELSTPAQWRRSPFGFRISGFFRISNFGLRFSLLFHREIFLFVFPLLDAALDAAQHEEFFLVVNHLGAAGAGERIIFLQKNRLLRADFLAKAAED